MVSGKNKQTNLPLLICSELEGPGEISMQQKHPHAVGNPTPIPAVGCQSGALPCPGGEKDLPWNRSKIRDCASAYGFCDHQGRDPQRSMELCQVQDMLLKLCLNPGITLALCSQIEVHIYIRLACI